MALFIGGIIGGFWMLGKILNPSPKPLNSSAYTKLLDTSACAQPSAPPKPNTMSKYITGEIQERVFKYNGTVLIMSNVRISNIHVYNKDKKKVDGKIIITCNDKEIFNQKMKNPWVDTRGLLLHNATIKIETKDNIPLEYTIYYLDMNVHKDELNMMGK